MRAGSRGGRTRHRPVRAGRPETSQTHDRPPIPEGDRPLCFPPGAMSPAVPTSVRARWPNDPVTRLVNGAGITRSNLLERASGSRSVTDTPGCCPGGSAGRRARTVRSGRPLRQWHVLPRMARSMVVRVRAPDPGRPYQVPGGTARSRSSAGNVARPPVGCGGGFPSARRHPHRRVHGDRRGLCRRGTLVRSDRRLHR